MARYQVVIDLDVNTQDLETAYMEAERLISAGASALGRATPMLTVAALVDQLPKTATVFTIAVPCTRPKEGAWVQVVFDPTARRGAVIAWDDNVTHSWPLDARALQWLVRGLMAWPHDLLDDMAREDEITRREAERRARGGK